MRLGILNDIHLCQPGSPALSYHNPYQTDTVEDRLRRAIATLEDQGIGQLAILGDLTHYGDAASMEEVLQIIDSANVPVWVLDGNHDLITSPTMLADMMSQSSLSNVQMLPGDQTPNVPGWTVDAIGIAKADGGGYRASPIPDVAAWPDEPILLLTHFPALSLRDACAEAGLKYPGDLVNSPELAAMLTARSAPTMVINGHLHIRLTIADGPVLQIACGAQVESLFEATVVDFAEWNDGVISIQATPVDPVWPGVDPALSALKQTWRWTGVAWTDEG